MRDVRWVVAAGLHLAVVKYRRNENTGIAGEGKKRPDAKEKPRHFAKILVASNERVETTAK